jgi:hypothetical protein
MKTVWTTVLIWTPPSFYSPLYKIEHSFSGRDDTLTNVELMREGQFKMQNASHQRSQKQSNSTNRFNDLEYKRWSESITETRSTETRSGIDSFLGTNENQQPGHHDTSIPLVQISSSASSSSISFERDTELCEHQRMSHAVDFAMTKDRSRWLSWSSLKTLKLKVHCFASSLMAEYFYASKEQSQEN